MVGGGFIDEVEAEAQSFLDGAEELFRRAPVRRVQLHWGGPRLLATFFVPRLGESSVLERLHGLDLSGNLLGSDGLQALLASPRLGGLTSLGLRECRIGDGGVRALAHSPLLGQLTRLDLSHNEIGPGGVRALARALEVRSAAGDPPRLCDLRLHGNPFGEAGWRAVLASPALRRIAELPPSSMRRGAPKR
jgi:Leucine Rich repeat